MLNIFKKNEKINKKNNKKLFSLNKSLIGIFLGGAIFGIGYYFNKKSNKTIFQKIKDEFILIKYDLIYFFKKIIKK